MAIQSVEELEDLVSGASNPSVAIDLMNKTAYDVRYQQPLLTREAAKLALLRARTCAYRKGEADALRNLGLAEVLLSEPRAAQVKFEEALEVYRYILDDEGILNVTAHLASVHQVLGVFDMALKLHAEVLTSATRRGDHDLRARTLYNMGIIYSQTGVQAKALEVHREALSIRQVLKDEAGTTLSMSGVGQALRALGRLAEAEKLLADAVERARKMDQGFLIGQPLLCLAQLYVDKNDPETAAELLEEAAVHHRMMENQPQLADTLLMQAELSLAQGEIAEAKRKLRDSRLLAEDLNLELLLKNIAKVEEEIHAKAADFPQTDALPTKITTFGAEKTAVLTSSNNVVAQALAKVLDAPAIIQEANQSANGAPRGLSTFLKQYTMDPKLSVDLLNATWRLRLPTVEQLRRRLPESFVYHLPLPGPCTDFYIQAERDNLLYLGIANAPGEGIEVSLFTQLAYEYLATLMYHPKYTQPAEILNAFQEYIRPALDHGNWAEMPEMRLAVVKVDQANNTITFSGAGLSIYWKGNQGWQELKVGTLPLRGGDPAVHFDDLELNGQKGNQLYLSTDGYERLAEVAELPPLMQQLTDMYSYDFSLKAPVLKSIIEKALMKVEAPDDILILGAGL